MKRPRTRVFGGPNYVSEMRCFRVSDGEISNDDFEAGVGQCCPMRQLSPSLYMIGMGGESQFLEYSGRTFEAVALLHAPATLATAFGPFVSKTWKRVAITAS
jgi:hypothetical protein